MDLYLVYRILSQANDLIVRSPTEFSSESEQKIVRKMAKDMLTGFIRGLANYHDDPPRFEVQLTDLFVTVQQIYHGTIFDLRLFIISEIKNIYVKDHKIFHIIKESPKIVEILLEWFNKDLVAEKRQDTVSNMLLLLDFLNSVGFSNEQMKSFNLMSLISVVNHTFNQNIAIPNEEEPELDKDTTLSEHTPKHTNPPRCEDKEDAKSIQNGASKTSKGETGENLRPGPDKQYNTRVKVETSWNPPLHTSSQDTKHLHRDLSSSESSSSSKANVTPTDSRLPTSQNKIIPETNKNPNGGLDHSVDLKTKISNHSGNESEATHLANPGFAINIPQKSGVLSPDGNNQYSPQGTQQHKPGLLIPEQMVTKEDQRKTPTQTQSQALQYSNEFQMQSLTSQPKSQQDMHSQTIPKETTGFQTHDQPEQRTNVSQEQSKESSQEKTNHEGTQVVASQITAKLKAALSLENRSTSSSKRTSEDGQGSGSTKRANEDGDTMNLSKRIKPITNPGNETSMDIKVEDPRIRYRAARSSNSSRGDFPANRGSSYRPGDDSDEYYRARRDNQTSDYGHDSQNEVRIQIKGTSKGESTFKIKGASNNEVEGTNDPELARMRMQDTRGWVRNKRGEPDSRWVEVCHHFGTKHGCKHGIRCLYIHLKEDDPTRNKKVTNYKQPTDSSYNR